MLVHMPCSRCLYKLPHLLVTAVYNEYVLTVLTYTDLAGHIWQFTSKPCLYIVIFVIYSCSHPSQVQAPRPNLRTAVHCFCYWQKWQNELGLLLLLSISTTLAHCCSKSPAYLPKWLSNHKFLSSHPEPNLHPVYPVLLMFTIFPLLPLHGWAVIWDAVSVVIGRECC